MDGEQFRAAMDGDPSFEDLENMTEAKRRRSREENDRRLAEEAKQAQEEKERREAEREARRHADDHRPDPTDEDPNEGNRFGGNH